MGLAWPLLATVMAMDSQGSSAARASSEAFREAMMAITTAESPYAEPVFAPDCVLELRRVLNAAHRGAGAGVVRPHTGAAARGNHQEYLTAPIGDKAARWMRAWARSRATIIGPVSARRVLIG